MDFFDVFREVFVGEKRLETVSNLAIHQQVTELECCFSHFTGLRIVDFIVVLDVSFLVDEGVCAGADVAGECGSLWLQLRELKDDLS